MSRWYALGLCALLGACAPAQLRREDLPPECLTPDHAALLDAAARSLFLVPYKPGRVYDVDAQNRPVPFALVHLASDALAVLSYPDPQRFSGGGADLAQLAHRSFLYDNALAVLWLSHSGDLDRARRLLATVAALQRPDGAWGFGFNTGSEDGFYNAAYVRTGTVAWVVYALAHYRQASHDPRFDATAERAIRWLLAQRAASPSGRQEADGVLFQGGSGRWVDTSHFEPDWPACFAATEHQIDVWFALRASSLAWPQLAHTVGLEHVAQQLAAGLQRWLRHADEPRYVQGTPADLTGVCDPESALDAAGTWSALWELAMGKAAGARELLAWVDAHHALDVHGWPGLRPYLDQGPATWFVEGSIARPLALWRLGEHRAAHAAWQPLLQLACMGGLPLVYAPDWHPDFPLTPAAAPTLWLLMAGQEIDAHGQPWLWAER